MSSYHLSRFLFDLKMDEAVFRRALDDLDEAMKPYDLSPEEKAALRSGDPRQLSRLGAHGMLALYVKRLSDDFRTNIYWAQK